MADMNKPQMGGQDPGDVVMHSLMAALLPTVSMMSMSYLVNFMR